MKTLKTLMATFAAISLVGAASAQVGTVIRITGSTAYRNATEDAITNMLKAGFLWGGVGGGIGNTQLIFNGALKSNSDQVTIVTSFTGSEGGIYNLTHPGTPPSNATYVVQTNAELAKLTVFPAAAANLPAGDATDNTSADIAMADTYQSSSAYTTPSLTSAATALPATCVGIVPFGWYGNPGNDAGITNMTHQQAKACLAGLATYALWNNSSTSRDDAVDVIGRDEDSGTRDTTFLESGFGAFTPPVQWEGIGTAGSFTGITDYPVNTVNGVTYPLGQSGFSSGKNVAAEVSDTSITNYADVVGYIGTSDAFADLKASTLVPISWEGVSFATAGAATYAATYNESVILSGQYTFWGYEHIYAPHGGPNSVDAGQAATDIVTHLENAGENDIVNENSGYLLADVVGAGITRKTDGSPVYFTN
jgi:hypothetical protein